MASFLKGEVAEDKLNPDFLWSGDFWAVALWRMQSCVQNRVQKTLANDDTPLKNDGCSLLQTTSKISFPCSWAYEAIG